MARYGTILQFLNIIVICVIFVDSTIVNTFTQDSVGFNHMTVDTITGDVYIGGVDYIYRLDTDLQLIYNITTKPDDRTDNYNKILSINYDDNNLVTCGRDNGYCQIRNLTDLSVLGDSDIYVAANTVEDSTVGFVAPGYDDKPMLYVGTSKRGLDYGREAVSGRQLEENIFSTVSATPGVTTSVSIISYYQTSDDVIYIQGFSYGGFSYFLTVQRLGRYDNSYISRIVRVCQERNDYCYHSYTEVTLQCNSPDGTSYNLLQAAHVMKPASVLAMSLLLEDGEHVLFAVFAKGETPQDLTPLHKSAMCLYKMTDIKQAFSDAISGCVNQGGDEYELDYISGSACLGFGGSVEECSTGGLYRYVNGKDPLSTYAILEYPNTLLTSIGVTTVQEHTVGFIGTQDGHILKVHFRQSLSAVEYYIHYLYSSTILSDIAFDTNFQHVYVLTQHRLYKVKVQDCNKYTTCSECFSAMDPYCGWCTLGKRCSLYSDCPLSQQTSRWLDVFSGDMCVNITSIEPTNSIAIAVRNQITLSVIELPDERDIITPAYHCTFGIICMTPAVQSGNVLTCDTPPIDIRPEIPSGQDSVAVQLSVKSVETTIEFVHTEFYFFDCSAHNSCTECVSSNWACDWCIYENKCTHESSTCAEDDSSTIVVGNNNIFGSNGRRGRHYCPYIEQQSDEVLVHVGLTVSLVVNAVNIPDLKGNPGYECILSGDGFEDSTSAIRYNESTLICDAKNYHYNADTQELNVRLIVQWNDNYIIDDIYGYIVTLYDCSVSLDCSECLSTVTSREKLQCGWCVRDNSCQIEQHCDYVWLPQDTNHNCGEPVIYEIWPSSGSFEGGTDIVISGSNFGKTYSHIDNVHIGGRNCILVEEGYTVSRSIECTTDSADVDMSGQVSVTVIGTDGTPQTGISGSSIQFTWRKQVLSDFDPKIGPKAGGTKIVITGTYMNAGRNITAYIDGSVCTVKSDLVNSTSIVCISPPHQQTDSATITVYFDGAARPINGITYEYTENPTVLSISKEESMFSGGRHVSIYGTNFGSIQDPKLIIYIYQEAYTSDPCEVLSDTSMICITPYVPYPPPTQPNQMRSDESSQSKRSTCGDTCVDVTIGFIMDDVHELRSLPQLYFKIYIDPVYFRFDNEAHISHFEGQQLYIKGENLNLASTRDEVTVYIGTEICNVTGIDNTILYCIAPESQPRGVDINGTATINNLPKVMVVVGNLDFFIGYLSYIDQTSGPNIILIVVSLSVVAFLLLIVIVGVIVIYQHKHIDSERQINDLRRNFLNMDIKLSDIKDENTTDLRGSTAEEELQTPVSEIPSEGVANMCTTSDYQTLQPQITSDYQALEKTLISREYESLQPGDASQYQSLNKPAVIKQQETSNYEKIGRSTPDTQPMESK